MGTSKKFDAPVKVHWSAPVNMKQCVRQKLYSALCLCTQIRVPRAFLPGSRSPSKSPKKGAPAASVTGTCDIEVIYFCSNRYCNVSGIKTQIFVGSTKAGIQAVLSPQPVAAAVVNSSTTAASDHTSYPSLPEHYWFDATNTGSFPPKPALAKTIDGVHGSQSKSFAPTESAIQAAVDQTGKSTSDVRALDMPFKHNKALPLELFDNPETEIIPLEERINNRPGGQPGALARSRFYDSRGQFAWAPCFVMAYDRYVGSSVWCQASKPCETCIGRLI